MNNLMITKDLLTNEPSNQLIEKLKDTVADTPKSPGVYIMRGEDGDIIYIGKAKSLKSRLKSYFSGEKDIKTATLMQRIRSIETIIVNSEYEALLLENTLIKQHTPKYNINLKDGKTYPVIRITHEDFPRIFKTRRIIKDESKYFGPFPKVHGVDALLEFIDKIFPLRKCKNLKLRGRKSPCMYYHIGRCQAPCCGKISIDEYARYVERVQQLLSGDIEALIIDLTAQMHKAAHDLQFEQAAALRNTIKAIENFNSEDSAVEDLNPEDRDYIAWAAEGVLATFTVFSMRGGKMTGRNLYRTRSAANESESLELFITSYYDDNPPPLKIFIQPIQSEDCTETAALSGWFKAKYDAQPELLTPVEKHHTVILAMARQNALEDLRKRIKERGAGPALEEMMRVLNLQKKPERIEGFDIAQLDGKHPVASLISFKNGVPDKKNYRIYKLRSVIGLVDDYAAMREVVHRRYSRLIREGFELPDLILIDGGLGQVNAAKGALDSLGIDCAVAGLAKQNEELWLPNAKNPIVLSRRCEALKVLQNVRDECHRFATNFNQRLRSKDLFFPILESVEGIGPQRAAAIMRAYENIANIAAADPPEIAERCGISETSARAVRAVAKLALEDQKVGKR
jgi:excinuclease ABC subunit C